MIEYPLNLEINLIICVQFSIRCANTISLPKPFIVKCEQHFRQERNIRWMGAFPEYSETQIPKKPINDFGSHIYFREIVEFTPSTQHEFTACYLLLLRTIVCLQITTPFPCECRKPQDESRWWQMCGFLESHKMCLCLVHSSSSKHSIHPIGLFARFCKRCEIGLFRIASHSLNA